MAKPQAKKGAPAKAAAPTIDPGDDPSKFHVVLSRVKARLPVLSSMERAAFRSLATDAQCAALGGRTKARLVVGEAVRWLVQIDKDGRDYASLFEEAHQELSAIRRLTPGAATRGVLGARRAHAAAAGAGVTAAAGGVATGGSQGGPAPAPSGP